MDEEERRTQRPVSPDPNGDHPVVEGPRARTQDRADYLDWCDRDC